MSSVQIATPFIVTGLAISSLLFVVNLSIVPLSKQRMDYVGNVTIKKRLPGSFFRQSRIWLRLDPLTFMNINLADSENSTLHGVDLYKLHPDFSLSELLQAERIQFENGQWVLYNGTRRTFLQEGGIHTEQIDQTVIPLKRLPSDFMQIEPDTDKMTYRDLSNYVKRLEGEGYNVKRYKVDLNNKAAMPFMSFVFGVIAVPIGLGRIFGHRVSQGIGLSLLIGAVYWVGYSLCIALGHAGVLPPFLAAWLPNFLFAAAGIILMSGLKH